MPQKSRAGRPSQGGGRAAARANGGARAGGGKPSGKQAADKRKPQRGRSAGPEKRGPEFKAPLRRGKPGIAASPQPKPAEAAPKPAPLPAQNARTVTVAADDDGMRLDRFLRSQAPQLSFIAAQKLARTGQVRVDGARAKPEARLKAGQSVRIPPVSAEPDGPTGAAIRSGGDAETRDFLRSITLFENDDLMVLNKPYGLAVQGGSGTTKHVDGMLDALRDARGQRPRLVHRIDKDTAGCLVIAKTRLAASELAKTFRSRSARKVYWAVVAGVPRVPQGRISTWLARGEGEESERMRIAQHGDRDAAHALTYYAVIDKMVQKVSWLSLKPVTGRTHQLRAHCAHIDHPILGDPKYFDIENWELPGGIQNRLHLLARRIVLPMPNGEMLDVSAPLPPHMAQTFSLLGFDASAYDPVAELDDED